MGVEAYVDHTYHNRRVSNATVGMCISGLPKIVMSFGKRGEERPMRGGSAICTKTALTTRYPHFSTIFILFACHTCVSNQILLPTQANTRPFHHHPHNTSPSPRNQLNPSRPNENKNEYENQCKEQDARCLPLKISVTPLPLTPFFARNNARFFWSLRVGSLESIWWLGLKTRVKPIRQ